MINEIEQNFSCPYCGENISMLLDLSEAQQQYIEDCEVCCRPIEINFTVVGEHIQSFSAFPSDS
ncbi:MAG: CPXCG motif-containing cysteine-rich protein [Nitrospinales bacterium]